MRGRKKKNLIIIILCIILVFMGAGYALLTQTLSINGTSKITGKWNVYIESITATKINGKAINRDAVISDNKKSATFTADLYDEGDYIEYTVLVKNAGTIPAKLNSIQANTTNPSEFVKFTNTAENGYELGPDSTMLFIAKIYVENNTGGTLTDAENIKFVLDLNFVQFETKIENEEEDIGNDYALITTDISLSANDSVNYTYYNDGKLIVSGTGATKDFLLLGANGATLNNAILKFSIPLKYIVKSHKDMTESDLYCNEGNQLYLGVCDIYSSAAMRMAGLVTQEEFNTYWNSGKFSTNGKEWLLDVINEFPGIKYIEIRDGITSIGSYMFSSMQTEQTSISIPNSVSVIKTGAFSGTNFENINFPNNPLFTEISENFCKNCVKLKTLVIPNSVTIIKNSAFRNHKELTSIDFGTGVTTLEDESFYSINGKLTSVTIPSNIITIGANVFGEGTILN